MPVPHPAVPDRQARQGLLRNLFRRPRHPETPELLLVVRLAIAPEPLRSSIEIGLKTKEPKNPISLLTILT